MRRKELSGFPTPAAASLEFQKQFHVLNVTECFVDSSKGTSVSGSGVINRSPAQAVEPLRATVVFNSVTCAKQGWINGHQWRSKRPLKYVNICVSVYWRLPSARCRHSCMPGPAPSATVHMTTDRLFYSQSSEMIDSHGLDIQISRLIIANRVIKNQAAEARIPPPPLIPPQTPGGRRGILLPPEGKQLIMAILFSLQTHQ